MLISEVLLSKYFWMDYSLLLLILIRIKAAAATKENVMKKALTSP